MKKAVSVDLILKFCKKLVSIVVVIIVVLTTLSLIGASPGVSVHLSVNDEQVGVVVALPEDTLTVKWWMEDVPPGHRVRVEFYIFDPYGSELEHMTYGEEGVGSESHPVVETWQMPSDANPGMYTCRVELYSAVAEPLDYRGRAEMNILVPYEISIHLNVDPLSVDQGETVTFSWWIENLYIVYQEHVFQIRFYIYDADNNVVEEKIYGEEGVGSESHPVVETWQVPSDANPGIYMCKVKLYGAFSPPITEDCFIDEEAVQFSVAAPPPPEFDFDLSIRSLDYMGIDVGDLLSEAVSWIEKDLAEVTVTTTKGESQDIWFTSLLEGPPEAPSGPPSVEITIHPSSTVQFPTRPEPFKAIIRARVTGRPALGSYRLTITASTAYGLSKSIGSDLHLYEGPRIIDFSPKNGWSGVRVTVDGVGLAGSQIFLGELWIGSVRIDMQTGDQYFVIPPSAPHGRTPITVRREPLGEYTTSDELEIFPVPDYCFNWGFKFHNPSQDSLSYPHLPWNEGRYRDTFGTAQVYWDILGKPIAPDPLAEVYYWSCYEWLAERGECFGMSAASILLVNRQFTPSDFDPTASRVNELVHAGELDRLIDYMHGAQVSLECIENYLKWCVGGVSGVLSDVIEAINRPRGKYGIICVTHGDRAHSMVPYLVEDVDDQHTRIYVYDPSREQFSTEESALDALENEDDVNNYPPYIEIDKTGFLWEWSFQKANGDMWSGRWASALLCFVPYEDLTPRTLPVSWEGLLSHGAEEISELLWFVSGDADVLVEDEEGRGLGMDEQGNMVIEIPNAIPIPTPEIRGFALPFGDYTSHIRGRAHGTYSWYVFGGASSAYAIQEAEVTATSEDRINLSYKDDDPLVGAVSFRTSDATKKYSATLIKQFPEGQKVYRIKNTSITRGSVAGFETTMDFNSLIYINNGPETITYDVEFQTTIVSEEAAAGIAALPTTTRTGIVIGPYEKHILTPENWLNLDRSAIKVKVIPLDESTSTLIGTLEEYWWVLLTIVLILVILVAIVVKKKRQNISFR